MALNLGGTEGDSKASVDLLAGSDLRSTLGGAEGLSPAAIRQAIQEGRIMSAILLPIGIAVLKALIPALGGLMGGPFGWLAGLAVSWLGGKLQAMIQRLGIINNNAARGQELSKGASEATEKWKLAAANKELSKEEKDKAYAEFKRAHAAIKFGSVQSRKN